MEPLDQDVMALNAMPNRDQLKRAYARAQATLVAERTPAGHWLGELSTSALSTATAVSALALVRKHAGTPGAYDPLIAGGVAWLAAHQNDDGGWGDTVKSVSNISTAMLGRAAFYLAGMTERYPEAVHCVEAYLTGFGKTPEALAEAVRARYGKDRTFAVPILTTCALAGLVSWKEVPPLPFELACFPQAWFRFLQLPVVSYALPALIAIGQAVYHHRPPRNPIPRLVRRLALAKSLRVLQTIQPSSGGFLEAVPLTSFVTLSLASIGQAGHPVARAGVRFLQNAVLRDGSWAIDSNLATWVTTLSVNSLSAAGELERLEKREALRDWLLGQQYTERHPYTGAEPGAWAWTDLPGGVPDADDTPGALLALAHLGVKVDERIVMGLRWLLDLQNRDGGWPTFCRGWGNLPFDRSGCDLTAHALRALATWQTGLNEREPMNQEITRASERGFAYLARQQRADGSWLPLWFGNQYAHDDENPTYGTARVLAAYRDLNRMHLEPARRGIAWLLAVQNPDGGWGGERGVSSTMEETALAVEMLLDAGAEAEPAVNRGLAWLVQQVEAGGLANPTPIGFYFAKLWYFEKLYPIIFTVAALGRALRKSASRPIPARSDGSR